MSPSERSSSAHILFIADLRRARCLTFSSFYVGGLQKVVGIPPGKVQWAGARARAGGESANHACPGAGAGGGGGHSAASAREESSRLISGCLADAKCVSGQQEEGRGSESSGSRRRSSRPTRSVSACARASESGRGWAQDRGRDIHTAATPRWATEPPAPLQWSQVVRALIAGNPRRRRRCPATPGRFVKFPGLAPRPDSLTSARPGRKLGLGQGGGVLLWGTLGAAETLLFPPWGRRGSGGGGRGDLRGEGCGRAGALRSWGSLGRGGRLEWEWKLREGAPGMERRAQGPASRRDVSARAAWRGLLKGCAASAGGLETEGMWAWGLADPRGRAGEGTGGSDSRLFSGTGRWEGIPRRARSWEGAVMG